MPDFGQCSDSSCNESAVRLFDCAHHCKKMVCLHHLIEHDRIYEQNKKQLETSQSELKRLYSIYTTLIDENKLRYDYEQKLYDYRKLVNEVNSLLENNSDNIEQYRFIIEKLKKSTNDKQKQTNEALTIVKVEPIEDSLSSTMNSEKDESIFIGFDRLQNLVIDTDYHKRQNSIITKNKLEKISSVGSDDYDDSNTNISMHRVAGQCPLTMSGTYGLSEKHHSHRLCRKKHFNDLSNHMRQYHGFLTPVANFIARAIDMKVPTTERLIPNDLQVIDPRRNFLCPLRSDCQYPHWLPLVSLRTHLIDVHHMKHSMADIKIKKIKSLNRNKPITEIRKRVSEVINQVKLSVED